MKHDWILVLTKGTQIPDVINYGPKKRERRDVVEKGMGEKYRINLKERPIGYGAE